MKFVSETKSVGPIRVRALDQRGSKLAPPHARRTVSGFVPHVQSALCVNWPKALGATKLGYVNAIQYLAPASLSGANVCSNSTPTCRALCLGWFSGLGQMQRNRQIRVARTLMLLNSGTREEYLNLLAREIEALWARAQIKGMRLCVRLNGCSDLDFAGPAFRFKEGGNKGKSLYEAFPDVLFVEYTKIARRMRSSYPSNLHLTFSRSELNWPDCEGLLKDGFNVAIVFAQNPGPKWLGYRVINGDDHDLRHLDEKGNPERGGFIVALRPKGGMAKRDRSGFVVQNDGEEWEAKPRVRRAKKPNRDLPIVTDTRAKEPVVVSKPAPQKTGRLRRTTRRAEYGCLRWRWRWRR